MKNEFLEAAENLFFCFLEQTAALNILRTSFETLVVQFLDQIKQRAYPKQFLKNKSQAVNEVFFHFSIHGDFWKILFW